MADSEGNATTSDDESCESHRSAPEENPSHARPDDSGGSEESELLGLMHDWQGESEESEGSESEWDSAGSSDDRLYSDTEAESFEKEPMHVRADRKEVLGAVSGLGGLALKHAAEAIRADREVVIAAISGAAGDARALLYASQDIRMDREFLLVAIRRDEECLKYVSKDLRSDSEFLLQAIKENGDALRYVGRQRRADRDFVLASIETWPDALRYAARALRQDRSFVVEALRRDGKAILSAPRRFMADAELVLIALAHGNSHRAIMDKAPPCLRKNSSFMTAAVECDVSVLQFASHEIRDNYQIVTGALSRGRDVFKHVSEGMQNTREVALLAAKHDGASLEHMSGIFRDDDEVVLAAVHDSGVALRFASARIKANKRIVMQAVGNDTRALAVASAELRADKEVVLAAMAQNPLEASEFSEKLHPDSEIWLACSKHKSGGPMVPENFWADRAFVWAAVQENGLVLEFVSSSFGDYLEMVIAAVEQNGLALRFASADARANKSIVRAAITKDASAMRYACAKLKLDRDLQVSAGLRGLGDSLRSSREDAHRYLVLSVRYGFGEVASDIASAFHKKMRAHESFRRHSIYDPNLVRKGFCGTRKYMTSLTWPCRGKCYIVDTRRTVSYAAGVFHCCKSSCFGDLSEPAPTKDSCWRFSFRWHQREAQESGGYMVQVVEANGGKFELGAGQVIETHMAGALGLKSFRVLVHNASEIDSLLGMLARASENWYNGNLHDLSTAIVKKRKHDDSADNFTLSSKDKSWTGQAWTSLYGLPHRDSNVTTTPASFYSRVRCCRRKQH